jgi:hypothetical protein
MAVALLFAGSDAMAMNLGGKELVKLGTGARTKGILGTVYYASLYVPQELKGAEGKAIVDAEVPSAVIMQIDSALLSKDKFVEATKDGFAVSARAGYATDKRDAFLKLFDGVVFKKGDLVYFNYVPKAGLAVSLTEKATGKSRALGTIAGVDLKRALFAIWIGPSPVQESLKKGMLGK